MESFARALAAVAEVMRAGAATHPDNDWVRCAPGYHIGRAEDIFFEKAADQGESGSAAAFGFARC